MDKHSLNLNRVELEVVAKALKNYIPTTSKDSDKRATAEGALKIVEALQRIIKAQDELEQASCEYAELIGAEYSSVPF